MSDRGLGQRFKFKSLTGDPCTLKASLFPVRSSLKNTNSETTSCGLPSGHSGLPPVCLSNAEERGMRLGGKRIFVAIPQNTSILAARITNSVLLSKSGRFEPESHARVMVQFPESRSLTRIPARPRLGTNDTAEITEAQSEEPTKV